MDELALLRQQLKPMAEAKGVKLSFMPFIIKVSTYFATQKTWTSTNLFLITPKHAGGFDGIERLPYAQRYCQR